ncbi:MAG: hypothetical protein JWM32_2432 [Verrucomicrobia bacterium]|nr:hypothetical protein [Verrucomicrobiota bacterium]
MKSVVPARIHLIAFVQLLLGTMALADDPTPARLSQPPPALQVLAPGEVEPTGWLRDWALAAAQGTTGHLDERAATFAKGWSGEDFEALGATAHGTGWPLEQCAYWFDGLVRLGYTLHDPVLIAKAKGRLDPVVDGVLKGGASFIYWMPREALNDSFNSWAHAQMGRALIAYYRASGDKRVLDALVKVYRDFPLPDLPVEFIDVCGAINLDPMLETYWLSGDAQILANARTLLSRPSFRQAVAEWGKGNVKAGHGVTFHEFQRVPALAYAISGDRRMLAATVGTIDWDERMNMLPMGVESAEEYSAGIGSFRYVETCNVAAGAWTDHWMLRLTGEASYGDRMENIFFNAAPAPIARDFQTLCYYQSPNRFSETLPLEEAQDPSARQSNKFTPVGHSVLCCAGNINRILPNYIDHMWMGTPDHGLAATLYGPSRVHTKVKGNVDITIDCKTNYPFEEQLEFVVSPARPTKFPLYLRVPAWCTAPSIEVEGKVWSNSANDHGFIKISRRWKSGDHVRLRLPMAPKVMVARETPFPVIKYFRASDSRKLAQDEHINNPYASVSFGPLLFALPIPDENPNQVTPGARWKFALEGKAAQSANSIEVVRSPMPAHWSWELDAPVRLHVPAVAFDWQPTDLQPLPATSVTGGQETKIELVPYGCTKFRVSMFPVTPELMSSMAPK